MSEAETTNPGAARKCSVRVQRFVMWLRWPETPTNNYVPWFVALRRLFWWFPMQTTRLLYCFVVAIGWGTDDALDEWKKTGSKYP